MPPVGARFCSDCGHRLEPASASAGGEALGDDAARAADGGIAAQGGSVAHGGSAAHGELRRVTVLFCDLVGSTELSARLDPEEFGDVLTRYHAAVEEVVERYGGSVVQFLGDGVLAVFGWPVAGDGDAERAVRAAIETLTAVAAAGGDRALAVRVGVHGGPVMVGHLGGVQRQRMVLGATMNLAARVQAAAPPGAVVITEATRRMVLGLFVTEELGEHQLKGFSDPVAVYRVVQPSGVRSQFEADGARLTPLIGRDAPLGALWSLWERVQLGEGAGVLVTGDPGIGKSRLVFELRRRMQETPHSWLETRCSAHTSRSAFHPASDLIERGLGLGPGDPPERRLAVLDAVMERNRILDPEAVPLLAALIGAAPPPRLTPDEHRRATLEVLARWVRELAVSQPLVLLVEDLHWADRSTIDLVARLAAECPGARLLLIGTARTGFEPPAGLAWPLTPLELSPLSEEETRALVTRLGDRTVVHPALVERVAAVAAGVPLFAEEVGRMLLERRGDDDDGAEREGRSSDRGTDSSRGRGGPPGRRDADVPLRRTVLPAHLPVPATLHDSLMARLDRVAVAKRVAQYAAVVGGTFDEGIVAALACDEMNETEVREGLGHLVADRILQRTSETTPVYAFRHALLEEAAYASLLRRSRRQLHARAAQELQRRRVAGDHRPAFERIAQHCEEAGRTDLAIERYVEAAWDSALRSGHSEAAAHLERALELLAEQPGADEPGQLERRCDLLLSAAGSAWYSGEYDRARSRYREAAEIAQGHGLARHLALAALGYGGRGAFGTGLQDTTLVGLLEAALSALDAGEIRLRARVTARLAEALAFSAPISRRQGLAAQARAYAEETGDTATIAMVLLHEHIAIWEPASLQRRIGIAREALRLSVASGEFGLEAESRMWLVADLTEAGDLPSADAEAARWEELAVRLDDRYQLWAVAARRAMRTLMRGDLAAAERTALAALELGQRGGNDNALQIYGVHLAHIRREQDRMGELEGPLRDLVRQYPAIATWRCALAVLLAECERLDEARSELHSILGEEFPVDMFWLADNVLAADACARLGDTGSVAVLRERLAPFRGRPVVPGPFTVCWGTVSRSLAQLAAVEGRHDEADVLFAEAVEQNRTLGARLWEVRAQVDWAEMLAGRGGPGDADRARLLLDAVFAAADELGLERRRHDARRVAARLAGDEEERMVAGLRGEETQRADA